MFVKTEIYINVISAESLLYAFHCQIFIYAFTFLRAELRDERKVEIQYTGRQKREFQIRRSREKGTKFPTGEKAKMNYAEHLNNPNMKFGYFSTVSTCHCFLLVLSERRKFENSNSKILLN